MAHAGTVNVHNATARLCCYHAAGIPLADVSLGEAVAVIGEAANK